VLGSLVAPPAADAVPIFAPDPVEFPDQRVGTNSASISVTVTNDEADPYRVSDVFLDGDDAAHFKIVSDSCSGAEITPSMGCAVSLSFNPTQAGDRVALLVLDNAGPDDAFGVLVAGFAYDPPTVVATPSPVAFGPVRRGSAAAFQSARFVNTGEGPVLMGAAALSGPDAAAFTISSDLCNGRLVAPTGSCSVRLRFRPVRDGRYAAELAVDSNGASPPHRVAVTGEGRPEADIVLDGPALVLPRLAAPFGEVTGQMTFRNVGDSPARFWPLAALFEPQAHARVISDTCQPVLGHLPPGERCVVTVGVTPIRSGAVSGFIRLEGATTGAILASGSVSGQVEGDPMAYIAAKLRRQLGAAAGTWRRSPRSALRRGFALRFLTPVDGRMTLEVRANRGKGAAAALPLVARTDKPVEAARGRRTFRARLTRAGRRALSQPGRLHLTARLRLRARDDTRRWRESRELLLR
jgi:hypothetical protein